MDGKEQQQPRQSTSFVAISSLSLSLSFSCVSPCLLRDIYRSTIIDDGPSRGPFVIGTHLAVGGLLFSLVR
ncbi:Uncharacterized protein APZ42_023695 [Daphnia magna]|uniref:Uncharacterized protein n=1 Tax=Daphnia magna TaxID=35525 RepID=A0A164UP89_9CRUS|nr:Uncharacterized protein APZ42_023695 [Daphnia magna]